MDTDIHHKKPSRNYSTVDWFQRHAPKATEWRKRQTELDLNTVEDYEKVVRVFIDHSKPLPERIQRDGQEGNQFVGPRFLGLPRQPNFNTRLRTLFANFQTLIYLSYCGFLWKRDVPYKSVDRIIQDITKSRERDRKRLLDSALWINTLIADLACNGWTIHRATELFFISTFLKPLACQAKMFPKCDVYLSSYEYQKP